MIDEITPVPVVHPWTNWTAVGWKLGARIAAYQLKHVSTGRVYVGMATDIRKTLASMSTQMRTSTATNGELQYLFDRDTRFEVTVELSDPKLTPDEQRNAANELAGQWMLELGSQCINRRARTKVRRMRQRSPLSKTNKGNPKDEDDEDDKQPMDQFHPRYRPDYSQIQPRPTAWFPTFVMASRNEE